MKLWERAWARASSNWGHYYRDPLWSPRAAPDADLLPVPAYRQTDSYTCGFTAGLMAVHYFFPYYPAKLFLAAMQPTPGSGVTERSLVRALGRCGVTAIPRAGAGFHGLAAAVRSGWPVIVGVQNPGRVHEHWAVVCGVGDRPRRVYVLNNRPRHSRRGCPWDEFKLLWRGDPLVCTPAR